jgi:hypothetical protein
MMHYKTRDAIREWDLDVDLETARLIREGTPPYDAVEQAKKIVSRRRMKKAQKDGEVNEQH